MAMIYLLLACLTPYHVDEDDGGDVTTPDCESLCDYLCEDYVAQYEVSGDTALTMRWCICYTEDTGAGYYWIELEPTQECEP